MIRDQVLQKVKLIEDNCTLKIDGVDYCVLHHGDVSYNDNTFSATVLVMHIKDTFDNINDYYENANIEFKVLHLNTDTKIESPESYFLYDTVCRLLLNRVYKEFCSNNKEFVNSLNGLQPNFVGLK